MYGGRYANLQGGRYGGRYLGSRRGCVDRYVGG